MISENTKMINENTKMVDSAEGKKDIVECEFFNVNFQTGFCFQMIHSRFLVYIYL